MDGNGRWAGARGMHRLIGHKRGAARIKDVVEASPRLGVGTLTLYAFSTENWKRSASEIAGLMRLFRRFLQDELLELHESNVRVRFLGAQYPLAKDIRNQMAFLSDLTKDNTGLNLNLAINYGGRDELVRAVRSISTQVVHDELDVAEIDAQLMADNLDTRQQPNPDLIIRTAGEIRLSNFMMWQSAYSEFIFLDESWPDFTEDLYAATLQNYQARDRRFGAAESMS